MAEILALNRAISPDSDYQVSRWYAGTILPTLFKTPSSLVNPTRIYRTEEQILLLEPEIQNHLIKRVEELGFDDLSLVFYDITSSYFEGWSCPIAQFGLSRDNQKNKLQLLLALAVTKEGFPFYREVLPGGLHDSVTVKEVASSFKKKFQLKKVVLVMDKGMVSKDNLKFLEKQDFPYIITIPRSSVKKLPDFPKELLGTIGGELEKEVKEKKPDLAGIMKKYPYFTYFLPRAYFHELKKEKKRRYILCFNPEKFLEERKQREKKLASIKNYLERWNEELSRAKYTKDKKSLGKEIYHYLAKRKTENLFIIKLIPKRKRIKKRTITTYKIDYQIKKDKLESLKLSDGIYCILSNLPQEKTSFFLVSSYRQRRKVEVAFSCLKGFIEIRPFYHQKEETYMRRFSSEGLSGAIVVTGKNSFRNKYFPHFAKIVPLIIVDTRIEGLKTDIVTTDDTSGAYEATCYLISLGHRRIAHLSGLPNISTAKQRIEGYRKALLKHNVVLPTKLIVRKSSASVSKMEEVTLIHQTQRRNIPMYPSSTFY